MHETLFNMPASEYQMGGLSLGCQVADVNVIDLWSIVTNCALCNVETAIVWSLPIYEGIVVPDNFVDPYDGTSIGGTPVCKFCFDHPPAPKNLWKRS